MTADTTPEAVERLARILDDLRNSSAWNHEAAATLRALAAERDAAWNAAIEAAAQTLDCGCPSDVKAAVTGKHPNSPVRWNACGIQTCSAIEAAAIRALRRGEASDGG